MLTFLFVVTRIVANPLSNLFQKQLTQRSANPVFVITVVHALLSAICIPLLLVSRGLNPPPGPDFWLNMVICALLAIAGNVLLVYALKSTDLSILGPINAYKAIVSVVLGIFLIGELPTLLGVAGMLLILAGSYFLVDRAVNQPRGNAFVQFFRERGVQLRLAALVLSATEAVFLKRALLLSTPSTTFALWAILGLPVAAAASAVMLRQRVRDDLIVFENNSRTYLSLAIATGVMQLTTVLTFNKLQVGYSLALFQMSTLISVFLGYRYFQEREIRKRLVGSVVMAAGAVLIVMFGTPP